MKVVVACENTNVSGHFGHCNQYLVVEVKNNEIISSNYVTAPEHVPGKLPIFIAELGGNVIISGGMGQKAVDLFNDRQIEVVVGGTGDALEAVKKYLMGELKSTGTYCAGHDD